MTSKTANNALFRLTKHQIVNLLSLYKTLSLRIIQVTQNVNKDATMLSCTIKSVFSL